VCITVYMQSNNADVHKAVQEHHLLLKTLSRSNDVKLVESAPTGDSVSVPTGGATTLHLDVTVSVLLLILAFVA